MNGTSHAQPMTIDLEAKLVEIDNWRVEIEKWREEMSESRLRQAYMPKDFSLRQLAIGATIFASGLGTAGLIAAAFIAVLIRH